MNPLMYLLEAFATHKANHPHRKPMGDVLCKLMSGVAPSKDDISVLVQGFAMQPVLDTLDLQDALDELNRIYGTKFTING